MMTVVLSDYPACNQARFADGSGGGAGWLRGWALVLHGTRAPPYAQLQPQDPHSKLAVVKKAHEDYSLAH